MKSENKGLIRELLMLGAVALLVLTGLATLASAQTPEKKASKEDASLLKPIVLTDTEKTEALDAQKKINSAINDANTLLETAKAQMTAAQEAIKRLQGEFNLYVVQVALKKRVDPEKYEINLAALDEKAEVLGFRPKPPPVPDKEAKK